VLPETQNKIMAAFKRMLKELDDPDHTALIQSVPPDVLYHLSRRAFPEIDRLLPGASDPAKFAEYVARISTPDRFGSLLLDLDDPTPQDLGHSLSFFKSIPTMLKRGLEDRAKRIRRTGGPPEKLSDPAKIQKITDEVFDAQKNGETLDSVERRIAVRENVSLSTVQRRVREEKKRRRSALASKKNSPVNQPFQL
jgi:hypothetical protein